VFSPTDCFCQNPEVVYRDVDEWKSGLAFEPDRPCLYMLNPTAMLMWELCRDGRRLDAIEQQYCELLGNRLGPEAARAQLHRGLTDMIASGLVTRTADREGRT